MFNPKPFEDKFNLALDHFSEDIKKIRTGRAHPSQLDCLKVEVYGSLMPLNQVANVVAIEAQLLQITPYDPANINAISQAIRSDQGLDLNPSDDGRVVRVPIPPLTSDRRQQLVKQAHETAEEAKINFRNIRQDAMKDIKASKEAKEMSEDEAKRAEKMIEETMAQFASKLEEYINIKEKEILTI